MFNRYLRFIKGISVSWWGKAGVILTTSSFVSLIVFQLGQLLGIITSSYSGLISYLLFPALFVAGLILIPIGWLKIKRQTGKNINELLKQSFDDEELSASFFGSKLFRYTGFLTLINVVFLILFSSQMLHFMDAPKFCGTACHSVMNPEWVTYQESPHAHVKCVECHVGEGTKALIDSKLNGVWQMISVTFNLLERPIPTPVHQLRPARETCEKCHWPDKFYGSRLKTITHYNLDEGNTPLYSTLNLKIDAGRANKRYGIHWHVAEESKIRFTSINDRREEIIWVEVEQGDGSVKRFINKNLTNSTTSADKIRIMDCVDCHNRATHIYENPEHAIDKRIHDGLISRELPFIKREGLTAITNGYTDKISGLKGIEDHILGYYQREYPKLIGAKGTQIDSAIAALQDIYSRNIHPEMNITWGTYPSHVGHTGQTGCFRCHNDNLVGSDGNSISAECTLCHSILADKQKSPFQYLFQPDTSEIEYQMHKFLRDEFLLSF